MSKLKIAVLGSTGMLGSIILDYLATSKNFEIIATLRDEKQKTRHATQYRDVDFRILDAEKADENKVSKVIADANYVINAIGIIKPHIHDDNADEIARAIRVNALFPHILANVLGGSRTKVIQIATDCVYSGKVGKYTENSPHDALDVYGKTKSLGEVYSNNFYHLRCSIIGPERKAHLSLLDWFLGQKKDANVSGYVNHVWNGVTTLHFAKICAGIIENGLQLDHVQHLIPDNQISKASLLESFAKEFSRTDIKIKQAEAETVIDRTLETNNPNINAEIWKAAGYSKPPTIEAMVKELANYNLQLYS